MVLHGTGVVYNINAVHYPCSMVVNLEQQSFTHLIIIYHEAIEMTPSKIINHILKESSDDSDSAGNPLPFQRNYKRTNKQKK